MKRCTMRATFDGPLLVLYDGAQLYASNRSSTTRCPFSHDVNLNGPAPTGARANPASPSLRTAVGDTGASVHSAKLATAAPNGEEYFTRTCDGLMTSHPAYGPNCVTAPSLASFGSAMVSKVNFTASASKRVPSWNCTSSRNFRMTLRPSAAASHPVAKPGSNLLLLSLATNVSNTCVTTWYSCRELVTRGSNVRAPLSSSPQVIVSGLASCAEALRIAGAASSPPTTARRVRGRRSEAMQHSPGNKPPDNGGSDGMKAMPSGCPGTNSATGCRPNRAWRFDVFRRGVLRPLER